MIDAFSRSLSAGLVVVQFEAFGDVLVEGGVDMPAHVVETVVLVRIDLQLEEHVVQIQLFYVEH